jgi:hypothetical protein
VPWNTLAIRRLPSGRWQARPAGFKPHTWDTREEAEAWCRERLLERSERREQVRILAEDALKEVLGAGLTDHEVTAIVLDVVRTRLGWTRLGHRSKHPGGRPRSDGLAPGSPEAKAADARKLEEKKAERRAARLARLYPSC